MQDPVAPSGAPASSCCSQCSTTPAPNKRGLTRGLCSRCYNSRRKAMKRDGTFVSLFTRSLVDRLLDNVIAGYGGCVVWTGAVGKVDGYGRIGDGKKARLTHRVSYEALVGPIPEGLHLDHLCRNRRCINPHHLEPVTQAENNRRARAPRTLVGAR